MNNLGVYIHVPYCSSKCRYCSFVSTCNLSSRDLYVERVLSEISECRGLGVVDSVYLGGGTPSVLGAERIGVVLSAVAEKFTLSKDCEITVEVNPESASIGFFERLVLFGVNRISIGLQCASDSVLVRAGRRHTVEQFIVAVNSAKEAGIDNISGDFIIGLEGETRKDIEKTLGLLVSLGVKHISAYSLSVERGCVMYGSDYRPDEDKMAEDYDFSRLFLEKNGYERYEISNFAKDKAYSRHNTKYWTHLPYVGFGPAAHSFYDNIRFANTDKVSDYLSGITRVWEEKIDLKELEEEFIMLRLRLKDGFSMSEYEKLFGKRFLTGRDRAVRKLTDAGVLALENDRVKATDKGIYVLNYIITELL